MRTRDSNGVLGANKKNLSSKDVLSVKSIESIEAVERYALDSDEHNERENYKSLLPNSNRYFYRDVYSYFQSKNDKKANSYSNLNVYVSVGDINGVGLELILRNHYLVASWCNPIYCISMSMLEKAAKMLQITIPDGIHIHDIDCDDIDIHPGEVTAESGIYSFKSFCVAVELSIQNNCPMVTLPIHKYSWNLANIDYVGHTHYLSYRFKKNAIMMLGCQELFVALYTDHMPLREVPSHVNRDSLLVFFKDFYTSFIKPYIISPDYKSAFDDAKSTCQDDNTHNVTMQQTHNIQSQINAIKEYAINSKMVKRLLYDSEMSSQETINLKCNNRKIFQIAVLGLNPHAGDNGVMGDEDSIIKTCIDEINNELDMDIFVGPLPPDSAFIPSNRDKYNIFIAMYHDSGLAPLKALYFDKSINVSLNLPILRTSPDHGTCFDKAYKKDSMLNMDSYIESFRFIMCHCTHLSTAHNQVL